MTRYLTALLLIILGGSAAFAQFTRSGLSTNTIPSPARMYNIILSSGFLIDTNTWIGTNTWSGTSSFTGPISFTKTPTSPAALPTISSCGATPPAASAGSNATGGQFTLGTSTPTACTVTFATAYATHSFCTITPASSGGAAISGGYYLSANDKTGFTLTIGTGTDSLVFNYSCSGN